MNKSVFPFKKRFGVLLLMLIVLCCGWKPECARAEEVSETGLEVFQVKENSFSCTYESVHHTFVLDLPEKTEGAPLVIMLPGYGNTAESFRNSVHFEQDAAALGYAVAYVTGAPDPNDRTSSVGWNSGISAEGNDDTAFLVSLVKYLQREYSLDGTKAFAVGFSNGAFMVHRLAMEAGDVFSACVSVAGLMPVKIWNERKAENNVSFFQITGEMDDVVPKNSDGSAKYAKAPAIENVMTYWAESGGLDICGSEPLGNGSVLTKCRSDEIQNQVWHLLVKNGRHSWPGEKLNGIDANRLILEFFAAVTP